MWIQALLQVSQEPWGEREDGDSHLSAWRQKHTHVLPATVDHERLNKTDFFKNRCHEFNGDQSADGSSGEVCLRPFNLLFH